MRIPQPFQGHIDKHMGRALDVAERLTVALASVADNLQKLADAENAKAPTNRYAPGGAVPRPRGKAW
jgi:hypothetical protein